MKSFVLAGMILIVGCSSGSGQTVQADSCLTAGASYLVSYTETSGNCGPVPSEVINVSSSGVIVSPVQVSCASDTVSGCMVQESDCSYTDDGDTFTYSSDVSFASNGSSGSGVFSVSATGSAGTCAGSYNITYTRQ